MAAGAGLDDVTVFGMPGKTGVPSDFTLGSLVEGFEPTSTDFDGSTVLPVTP